MKFWTNNWYRLSWASQKIRVSMALDKVFLKFYQSNKDIHSASVLWDEDDSVIYWIFFHSFTVFLLKLQQSFIFEFKEIKMFCWEIRWRQEFNSTTRKFSKVAWDEVWKKLNWRKSLVCESFSYEFILYNDRNVEQEWSLSNVISITPKLELSSTLKKFELLCWDKWWRYLVSIKLIWGFFLSEGFKAIVVQQHFSSMLYLCLSYIS